MKFSRIAYILIFAVCANMAWASDSIKSVIGTQSVSFGLRPSWVIPTSDFLKSKPSGHYENSVSITPDLRYSFRFNPSSKYGALYPTVYQGIGISYTQFMPDATLGHPVNLYIFQGARLASLGSRLSLDYEWNLGISAGWDEYHKYNNPYNTAIGSNVNALINLGVILSYKLSDNWIVRAGLEGTHYSNGNTTIPNAGVNSCGARIGLAYLFNNVEDNVVEPIESFRPHLSYDLTVYGAVRQRMYETQVVPGRFGIIGMNFAPMYGFNKYLRAGGSLDFQYDESANLTSNFAGYDGESPVFFRQSFNERFSMGLSMHAELTMPIFSINVGIGRNIIAKGYDTEIWYQSLALKAYVFQNSYLQVGYQLRNFHTPNNLMLGIGYSFGK